MSESIFAVLNRRLIGAAAWTPRAGGGFETTVDVPQEMADSEAGRLFAKHFLTLEENVALRERDVPANTPATITVTGQSKRGGRQKQVLTPDWNGVLATARGKLKDKLASGEPAPVEKEDVRLVDAVVLGDTDSAMKRLREIGLITGPGDVQFHATATSGAGLDRTDLQGDPPGQEGQVQLRGQPPPVHHLARVAGDDRARERRRHGSLNASDVGASGLVSGLPVRLTAASPRD